MRRPAWWAFVLAAACSARSTTLDASADGPATDVGLTIVDGAADQIPSTSALDARVDQPEVMINDVSTDAPDEPAHLVVSPTSVSVSGIVDQASQPIDFVVTNDGGAPSGTPTVTLRGDHGNDFRIASNDCTTSLLPKGQCRISVVLLPACESTQEATLTITALPGGTTVASLTATSTLETLRPSSPVQFGPLAVGQTSAPMAALLENVGCGPAGPFETATSFDTANFSVVNDGCAVSVPSRSTCSVSVAFHPVKTGLLAAVLVLSGGASGQVVFTLTGTGISR